MVNAFLRVFIPSLSYLSFPHRHLPTVLSDKEGTLISASGVLQERSVDFRRSTVTSRMYDSGDKGVKIKQKIPRQELKKNTGRFASD